MIYIKNYLIAVAAICCICSFQSCKKSSDPAPTPVPTPRPDTLTAGWSKQVIAGEPGLSDIFFNSSTNGYVCASSSIYKTTDGGAIWSKLSPPILNWINCFVTTDGKVFFINNSSANIFKTLDGGSTFISAGIGAPGTDVFFTDNSNGYCIGYDGLYNTTDAGVTWQKITTTGLPSITPDYASLSFVNSTTGWVVSKNGIYRSAGSLTIWQQSVVSGATAGSSFAAVYSVSASIVYATNFSGEIFKSTDGGANFSLIKKLEDVGFTDIHFITSQTGYVSAGRSIYKTTDSGLSWSKVVSLGENNITEIHFTDATHGWACCSNSIVLTFK